jgi:RNA polymerase sigma-70 factor (ECF subfamily)
MDTEPNENHFAQTRWTLVERTRGNSPQAQAALRELCTAYYAPVVAFLRRELPDEDSSRDLAHEFFAKLLEGNTLGDADRRHGRFRSYLLGAVKHFLINKRREAAQKKRGGGRENIPLDQGTDTSPGLDVPDERALPSDAIFDRQWAMVIIERALAVVQTESEAAGQTTQFALIKGWLSPAGTAHSQAEAARQLGMAEGALKVAIHRLRKRFRQLVRAEISHTLNNPADLDEEMRHLIDVLAITH